MSEQGDKRTRLTDKQERFCQEYIVDLNATQAAIRAQYSEKTAYSIGEENLRKPEILSRISELQEQRLKRVRANQDYVISSIVEVVERCMQKAPVMRFDKEAKDYVQVQDEEGRDVWQFKAGDALKGLELLGRHHALFTDRVEQNGTLKVQNVPDMSDDELQRIAAGGSEGITTEARGEE